MRPDELHAVIDKGHDRAAVPPQAGHHADQKQDDDQRASPLHTVAAHPDHVSKRVPCFDARCDKYDISQYQQSDDVFHFFLRTEKPNDPHFFPIFFSHFNTFVKKSLPAKALFSSAHYSLSPCGCVTYSYISSVTLMPFYDATGQIHTLPDMTS